MSDNKKLYRSTSDRWVAGICGGIAEYFNVDPILIRVLFVLFGFAVGGSLIIYLILWLIIPEAPAGDDIDIEPDLELDPEPPADEE